ncbi:AaceriAER371Cp [[Ashbya] aceris (nom. inval.)]|nr:AaceriAER371Cp [[Ashbya] aceris (nom. inval.)]
MANRKEELPLNDESTEDEDNSFIGEQGVVSSGMTTATSGSAPAAANYKVRICRELGLLGEDDRGKPHKYAEEEVPDIDGDILREYIELRLTNERMALESLKRDNLNKIDEILTKLIDSNFPLGTFDKLLQSSTAVGGGSSMLGSDGGCTDTEALGHDRKRKKLEPRFSAPPPSVALGARHRRYNSELGLNYLRESTAQPSLMLPQVQQRWNPAPRQQNRQQHRQHGQAEETGSPPMALRYPPPMLMNSNYTFPAGPQQTLGPHAQSRASAQQSDAQLPSRNIGVAPSSQLSQAPPLTSLLSKHQPHHSQPTELPTSMHSDNRFAYSNSPVLKSAAYVAPSSSGPSYTRGHRRTQSAQVRMVPEMSTFTVSRSPTIIEHRVDEAVPHGTNNRQLVQTQSSTTRSPPTVGGASTSSKVSFLIHTPKHPPKR